MVGIHGVKERVGEREGEFEFGDRSGFRVIVVSATLRQ